MSVKILLIAILALLSLAVFRPAETAHAQIYDDYYACTYNPYYGYAPCYNYDYSYYPYWGFYPFFGFNFDFDRDHFHHDRDFDRFGHRDFDPAGNTLAAANRGRFSSGFGGGAHSTFNRGSMGGGFHGGAFGGGGGMHASGGMHAGGGHSDRRG
jgi:hypothetical protein